MIRIIIMTNNSSYNNKDGAPEIIMILKTIEAIIMTLLLAVLANQPSLVG
jgi:hypothetical protein